jgi:hypothetical protein
MELKEMSVEGILEQARARGLRTRGMSRDAIIEAIESTDAGKILQTGDDVPKSERYEELNRRIQRLEIMMEPKGTEAEKALSNLSWNDLLKLAKNNNVQVHGKKRPQIEAELKELDNG